MATPLPIITDGFRVTNIYGSDDAQFTNTYWVQSGTTVTPTALGSAFIDAYDNNTGGSTMRALHSSSITLHSVDVTALDGVTPTVNVPRAAGVHGTGVANAAAANAALVITWLTGIRGRAARGRTFLGGLPASSMEDGGGLWSTAILTDALDWVQNFLDAIVGHDLQLLMVSQRSTETPGLHVHPITDFTPRAGVGTQRGRTERNKP